MKKNELKYECLDNNALPKGGEYCYLMYPWEQDYDDLFQCLEDEGLPKTAQYCDQKFTYLESEAIKAGESFDIQQKWDCYAEYGIPQTDLDCKAIYAAEGATFVQDTVVGNNIELSKNLKTGETNFVYSYEPGVENKDLDPHTLMSDRDFRFTGMHINYMFNSKLFYAWVQEPNWQNYLNSRDDIDVPEPIEQSWGTFLWKLESTRRRLLEIPSVNSLLEKSKSFYRTKLIQDDPTLTPDQIQSLILEFSEFGADIDFGAALAITA